MPWNVNERLSCVVIARVRSTTGSYIFSLSVHGGGGTPARTRTGYSPAPVPSARVPPAGQVSTPSQSGPGHGTPPPRAGNATGAFTQEDFLVFNLNLLP